VLDEWSGTDASVSPAVAVELGGCEAGAPGVVGSVRRRTTFVGTRTRPGAPCGRVSGAISMCVGKTLVT